jgi:DNA-3-methyladenine glycosylase II
MWGREPGFQTLVLIILEQQVSLASAHFAFQRLKEVARPLTPAHFLRCSHGELRKAGFSRQKMSYCRGLAESVLAGELCLKELESMDDDAARSRLTAIKGIGQWSADIYLLRALLRPDVWPSGDLALAKAVQELKGLTSRPAPNGLEAIAEPWRPWRAVAARTLWQFYLRSRGHR